MSLELKNISYKRGETPVLQEVNLLVEPGEVCVLLGANGAGKSTLLSIIAGELQPQAGGVSLFGKNLTEYSLQELALIRAFYVQNSSIRGEISVSEVVERGRIPYQPEESTARSRAVSAAVLVQQNLEQFKPRLYSETSGGEQQRVQFARILSQIWQNSKALVLLDEATSNLDASYQLSLLNDARRLAEAGAMVVMAIHDINLASQVADTALVLKAGEVIAAGQADTVFRKDILMQAFDIGFLEIDVPDRSLPVFIPQLEAYTRQQRALQSANYEEAKYIGVE